MARNAGLAMRAICCFNFPRTSSRTLMSQFVKSVAHILNITFRNSVKKWKRQRSSVDPFRNWQWMCLAGFMLVDRLPMDRREISAAFDIACRHLRYYPFTVLAIKMRSKADYVHKPANGASRSVAWRNNEVLVAAKFLRVDCRYCLSAVEYYIKTVELGVAQSAAHLGKSIVVSQIIVPEISAGFRSALIAKLPRESGDLRIPRHDRPALSGRDLFIGIEGEHSSIAQSAALAAIIFRADCFASVFQHKQAAAAGNVQDRRHLRRKTKCMHNNNAPCSRSDGLFNCRRIKIERVRFDIHKYRNCSLISNGIRYGNEREGWHDDFVARPDAECAKA